MSNEKQIRRISPRTLLVEDGGRVADTLLDMIEEYLRDNRYEGGLGDIEAMAEQVRCLQAIFRVLHDM